MNSVTVRVPATTANLACGFDTLGCALSLYNTLSFTLSDRLSFTGCDEEFQTPDNLACQGFDAVYARLGRPAPSVHIDIRADIPVCRGLGSSAAMLAAGAMAANALSGAELSKAELLSIITPIEGHPDNLAPALFGGLVASTSRDGKVYSAHYPVHESLHFVVLSPDYTLSTHKARAALPSSVSFADAVFDLSHLAMRRCPPHCRRLRLQGFLHQRRGAEPSLPDARRCLCRKALRRRRRASAQLAGARPRRRPHRHGNNLSFPHKSKKSEHRHF